jgi:hypothetical protein
MHASHENGQLERKFLLKLERYYDISRFCVKWDYDYEI